MRCAMCTFLLALVLVAGQDPAGSWLTYAVWKAPNQGVITALNTTWTVPGEPTVSRGSNAPGWWFGTQTARGDGALVQPILAYGYQGSVYSIFNGVYDWTDGSWHTSRETFTVQPGDKIISSVTTSDGGSSYDMRIESTQTGKSILTNYKIERGQTETESVAYFVLEHQPNSCQAYPANGECTFQNIYVEVEGKAVTNPAWVAKLEQPACNSKTTIVDPKTIKITWDATSSEELLVSDIVAKAPRKWADAVAPEPARDYKKMWEDFKVQYGKTYDSNGAEEARFAIFRTNVDYIEATNAQQLGYMLGVNQFADLTEAEVVEQYTGARKPGPLFESPYLGEHVDTDGALPDSVDWTAQGKVTPVKNQGHCGSCWAFSSTGALESANMIATGSLVSLSEQQLVDCHVDSGCSGGWPHDSFRYAESTAMCTESEYPYTAKDGSCHANSCTGLKRGAVTGYRSVAKTESDLRSAVAKGPVSITVQVAGGFHSYKSGVLSGGCSGSINHAVLAVGYGTEDGKKYWKVKNSWGASWGMDGYLLLQRGSGGQGAYCVLQDSPAYPVVASGPSPPTPPSPPSPPSPPTPPTPPTPPSPPSGQCHALSAVVTDQWCNDNCHAAAPYCPADLCRCDPSSLLV